jgi:hypothetical protein
MWYSLLADLVLIIHLLFIAFVVAGGFLVLRKPKLAWLHLPAAVWGILIEWYRLPCPLTPLEKWALLHAGKTSYEGGFIGHYLIPIIYPGPMPMWLTAFLAIAVLLINISFYTIIWKHKHKHKHKTR